MDSTTKNADLTVSVAHSAETLCAELRGIADLANHDHLQAVLQAVPLNGTDTVHLRLSQLSFCDVRALTYLSILARRVQNSGQPIATLGASPTIRKAATADPEPSSSTLNWTPLPCCRTSTSMSVLPACSAALPASSLTHNAVVSSIS